MGSIKLFSYVLKCFLFVLDPPLSILKLPLLHFSFTIARRRIPLAIVNHVPLPSRAWKRFTKIYLDIVIVTARPPSHFPSYPRTLLVRSILVYKPPRLAMAKARNLTPAFASSLLRPVTISFELISLCFFQLHNLHSLHALDHFRASASQYLPP